MKTLSALLVLAVPAAYATSPECSVQEMCTECAAAPIHVMAAAKTEKSEKSSAPAPTPPSTPPPKQPQRQERAPKPAPPAHLFM